MEANEQVEIVFEGTTIKATVISVFLPGIQRFLRDQMSSSGGTAITVHRCACHLFDNIPSATRILYLSTLRRLKGQLSGTVLLLVEINGRWFDPQGDEAKVLRGKDGEASRD